jgi:hypothetical protein
MPKRYRKGGEMHAKTHQKAMLKQVSEKIRKNMKFNVFLKG